MAKMKITDEELIREIKSGKSLYRIHKEYGISVANLSVRARLLNLKVRDFVYEKEWRRLSRNGKYPSRVLSIPFRYLKKLGFKQDDELYGRWKVTKKGLLLEVKRGGSND